MNVFVTHIRVVCALLVREVQARFGSKPGGYIWALLDPAAHVALMTLLFQALTRTPALGTSFPLFFATGYIGFQFYNAMTGYLNGSVKANRSLLTYPNVAPIDTITARSLLQLMTTMLVACIVLGVILASLRTPQNLHWPAILEAMFVASILGIGTGMINNVMFVRYPLYEQLFTIVHRPLFLLSGIFFLPDSLPLPYRDIVLLNPLIHVTMLFRTGFYEGYRAVGLDTAYLYGFAFLTLFTGMVLFTFSSSLLRNE